MPPDRAGSTPSSLARTSAGWKYLQTADLRRLRNFQFAANVIVEGYFQGRHRSPYYDFSSEFADYRPYMPGDDIRTIDWRAFARTDRFYIKLFRKETDMNCYLLVDKSNSMAYPGSEGVSKLEYASYMAAGLSYLIMRQSDKVSLSLGDNALQTYVPAGGTQQSLRRICSALEHVRPGGVTGLAAVLHALFGILKRKGLLIVFSDFLDEPSSLFSALNMFVQKGFTVLLFQVLTTDEISLPSSGNALFQDMETSDFAVADPDSIREAYQAEIRAFLNEIESGAKARRIQYQLVTTATPYYAALEAYLTARGRLR